MWDHFFKHWIAPFGVPRRLIYDQGGEFEREFAQELEDLGCEAMPTAAITPQQNAVCERHRESGKHMRDDCLTSSASSLCLNSCSPPPSPGHAILPSMTSGTLLHSGFSDEDCDCRTRCWIRPGGTLCTSGTQEVEHSLNASR